MSDYLADQLRAFDPNQKKHIPYATWGNHGGFKLHLHRGGATTRYGTNDYAVYYEMGDNGLWTEIFRKCRPDENFTCTMCGHTTRLAEGMFGPTLTYGWRGCTNLMTLTGSSIGTQAGTPSFGAVARSCSQWCSTSRAFPAGT